MFAKPNQFVGFLRFTLQVSSEFCEWIWNVGCVENQSSNSMNEMVLKKFRKSKRYQEVKYFLEEEFWWSAGVKKKAFGERVLILKKAEQKKRGDPRGNLGIEDRLLMALEYLREYRTYFHIGKSDGLIESAAYRNCRWVEDTLIESRKLSLPGRKAFRSECHT